MRKIGSIFIRILFIPIILFVLFLLFFSVTEYRPEEDTRLLSSLTADTIRINTKYTALIWNIGYAGLGENMDFFYAVLLETRTISETNRHNPLLYRKEAPVGYRTAIRMHAYNVAENLEDIRLGQSESQASFD